MRRFNTWVICLAVAGTAACSRPERSNRIDVNSLKNSEELALAGEQLLSPTSFMYADAVFAKALEWDPSNFRARFYRAMIKPMMVSRGIIARVQPIVKQYGNVSELNKNLNQVPESGLKTFLYDGVPDITNEKTAQEYVDAIRNAYDELRIFAKENKSSEIVLNLNPMFFYEELKAETLKECVAEVSKPGIYDIKNCDFSKMLQVKIGQAEFEGLQHMAAGFTIYSTIPTSYDLTGLLEIGPVLTDSTATPEMKSKAAFAKAQFGKLRDGKSLKAIVGMGSDALSGARWLLDNQSSLCPMGRPSKKNRPGFLMKTGACSNSGKTEKDQNATLQALQLAEQSLRGPVADVVAFTTPQGQDYRTVVDTMAPFRSPVPDLRQLAPSRFNECGQFTELSDSSFGGVYPNGDGNLVMAKTRGFNDGCLKR